MTSPRLPTSGQASGSADATRQATPNPVSRDVALPTLNVQDSDLGSYAGETDIYASVAAPIVGRTVDISQMAPVTYSKVLAESLAPDAALVVRKFATDTPMQALGLQPQARSMMDVLRQRPPAPVWVESEMLASVYAPAVREPVRGHAGGALAETAPGPNGSIYHTATRVAPSSLYVAHFGAAVAAVVARTGADMQVARMLPTVSFGVGDEPRISHHSVVLYANTESHGIAPVAINTDSRVQLGDNGDPRAVARTQVDYELTYTILENAFSKLIGQGGAYTLKPFDPLYRDTNPDAIGQALTAVAGAPSRVMDLARMPQQELQALLNDPRKAIVFTFAPEGEQAEVPPGYVPVAQSVTLANPFTKRLGNGGQHAPEYTFLADIPYAMTHFNPANGCVELLNVLKNSPDFRWYEEDADGIGAALARQKGATVSVPLTLLVKLAGVNVIAADIPYGVAQRMMNIQRPLVGPDGQPLRAPNGQPLAQMQQVVQMSNEHLTAAEQAKAAITLKLIEAAQTPLSVLPGYGAPHNLFDAAIFTSEGGAIAVRRKVEAPATNSTWDTHSDADAHQSTDTADKVQVSLDVVNASRVKVSLDTDNAPDARTAYLVREGHQFTWFIKPDNAAMLPEAIRAARRALLQQTAETHNLDACLTQIAKYLRLVAGYDVDLRPMPEVVAAAEPQAQAAQPAAPLQAVAEPQGQDASGEPSAIDPSSAIVAAIPRPASETVSIKALQAADLASLRMASGLGAAESAPPANSIFFHALTPELIAPTRLQTVHFAAALAAVSGMDNVGLARMLTMRQWARGPVDQAGLQQHTVTLYTDSDQSGTLQATPVHVTNAVQAAPNGGIRTLRAGIGMPGSDHVGSLPFHGYAILENAFTKLSEQASQYAFEPFSPDNGAAIGHTLSAVTGAPTTVTKLGQPFNQTFWPGAPGEVNAALVTLPSVSALREAGWNVVDDQPREAPVTVVMDGNRPTLLMSDMPYAVVSPTSFDPGRTPAQTRVLLQNVLATAADPTWYEDNAEGAQQTLSPEGVRLVTRQGVPPANLTPAQNRLRNSLLSVSLETLQQMGATVYTSPVRSRPLDAQTRTLDYSDAQLAGAQSILESLGDPDTSDLPEAFAAWTKTLTVTGDTNDPAAQALYIRQGGAQGRILAAMQRTTPDAPVIDDATLQLVPEHQALKDRLAALQNAVPGLMQAVAEGRMTRLQAQSEQAAIQRAWNETLERIKGLETRIVQGQGRAPLAQGGVRRRVDNGSGNTPSFGPEISLQELLQDLFAEHNEQGDPV